MDKRKRPKQLWIALAEPDETVWETTPAKK
jgi:hypothetical protein